jgi:hypothetical protein
MFGWWNLCNFNNLVFKEVYMSLTQAQDSTICALSCCEVYINCNPLDGDFHLPDSYQKQIIFYHITDENGLSVI